MEPDGRLIAYRSARSSVTPPTIRTNWPSSLRPVALRAPHRGATDRCAPRSGLLRHDSFSVSDDRSEHIARVPASGGKVETLVSGPRVVNSFSPGNDGGLAVIASTATQVPEIHALEAGKLRKLTRQNDDWVKNVLLGTTEEFAATSKDGTDVHGLIVKPPVSRRAQVSALLRIHAAQWPGTTRSASSASSSPTTATWCRRQLRGSNGRGSEYRKPSWLTGATRRVIDCWARWITSEVDYVDGSRLGIAAGAMADSDQYNHRHRGRFKAAISGEAVPIRFRCRDDMYISSTRTN